MIPAVAPVASVPPAAPLHRFDAYRLALAFRAHVVRWLPLKRAELSDQLDRASISAVLNVAGRSRLERMEKHSESIRKNVDGISDEVRKAQKALDVLLRKAKSTLEALKVELHDEDAERSTPIGLPNGSFESAVLALPGGTEAA